MPGTCRKDKKKKEEEGKKKTSTNLRALKWTTLQ
jgi:hypothetical protein